jgi:type VI secretion system protein ImpA
VIRQEWLQPLAPEAPCGPNLENEQEFLLLEQATKGKEEQQYGDKLFPAQPPDWADVVSQATTLLDRSRDLRTVLHLTRGLVWTQGLPGLRDGLLLARDLLTTFWEPLHPQLVVDGEPDAFMRLNALAAIGDATGEGLVRDTRAALFLKCPLGTFTIRDIERILDPSADPAEQRATSEQLRTMVRDAIVADATALVEATQCLEALDEIRKIAAANFEPAQLPDFGPLRSVLQAADSLTSGIRNELAALAADGSGSDQTAGGGAGAPDVVGVGDIRTRADAVRALERVCDFLARNEPTNPAPLLIRRAQRIMTMPFMDIIRELAPEAVGNVENITGARQT